MERVLKELHPKQDYRLILLEEYGHIDGIIGKYAVSDIWPEVLSFLDMHSHSSSANDERLAKVVAQTMHQLELIGSTADLSEELRAAICHDATDFGFKSNSLSISIYLIIGMYLDVKRTLYDILKFVSLVFVRYELAVATLRHPLPSWGSYHKTFRKSNSRFQISYIIYFIFEFFKEGSPSAEAVFQGALLLGASRGP